MVSCHEMILPRFPFGIFPSCLTRLFSSAMRRMIQSKRQDGQSYLMRHSFRETTPACSQTQGRGSSFFNPFLRSIDSMLRSTKTVAGFCQPLHRLTALLHRPVPHCFLGRAGQIGQGGPRGRPSMRDVAHYCWRRGRLCLRLLRSSIFHTHFSVAADAVGMLH